MIHGGWALDAIAMTAKLFVYMAIPVLGAALFSGVVIGVVQVASQLSDLSVGFVPKIIIVMISLFFFGHWMLHLYAIYMMHYYANIPMWINQP
ncbi:hypothetical protein HAP94_11370 [Acidithiobacillus ferrivorans]|jgi:flagellar biosynthetic protein FliQ|nr:hypothetical protein [Acidithiobacillus ferrivorans]